jgi:hypothetical protein
MNELLISELSYSKVYEALKALEEDKNLSASVLDVIRDFKKMVPYRLLSPWFKNDLRGIPEHQKNKKIVELSKDHSKKALYQIDFTSTDMFIKLDPNWREYIQQNWAFLDGWWRWEFISFLQIRNPTVLSLSNKLHPKSEREMLNIKKIFKGFYEDTGSRPACFYSGRPLQSINHDHFLPWSFLGSDLTFNFVPCHKSVNSSKSNSIPSIEYVRKLSEFQFEIYNWLKQKEMKAVEEFVRELSLSEKLTKASFESAFIRFYEPLYLTARNQRFSMNWM